MMIRYATIIFVLLLGLSAPVISVCTGGCPTATPYCCDSTCVADCGGTGTCSGNPINCPSLQKCVAQCSSCGSDGALCPHPSATSFCVSPSECSTQCGLAAIGLGGYDPLTSRCVAPTPYSCWQVSNRYVCESGGNYFCTAASTCSNVICDTTLAALTGYTICPDAAVGGTCVSNGAPAYDGCTTNCRDGWVNTGSASKEMCVAPSVETCSNQYPTTIGTTSRDQFYCRLPKSGTNSGSGYCVTLCSQCIADPLFGLPTNKIACHYETPNTATGTRKGLCVEGDCAATPATAPGCPSECGIQNAKGFVCNAPLPVNANSCVAASATVCSSDTKFYCVSSRSCVSSCALCAETKQCSSRSTCVSDCTAECIEQAANPQVNGLGADGNCATATAQTCFTAGSAFCSPTQRCTKQCHVCAQGTQVLSYACTDVATSSCVATCLTCSTMTAHDRSLYTCTTPSAKTCVQDTSTLAYCAYSTPATCVNRVLCSTCTAGTSSYKYFCSVDDSCKLSCDTCGSKTAASQTAGSPGYFACDIPSPTTCANLPTSHFYCETTKSCMSSCSLCANRPVGCPSGNNCVAAVDCLNCVGYTAWSTQSGLMLCIAPTTEACAANGNFFCDLGSGVMQKCLTSCASCSVPSGANSHYLCHDGQCRGVSTGTTTCATCQGATVPNAATLTCSPPTPTICGATDKFYCARVSATSSLSSPACVTSCSDCIDTIICGGDSCVANCGSCSGYPWLISATVPNECAAPSPTTCYLANVVSGTTLTYCPITQTCVTSCAGCTGYPARCPTDPANYGVAQCHVAEDCRSGICLTTGAFDPLNSICVTGTTETCKSDGGRYLCPGLRPSCVSTSCKGNCVGYPVLCASKYLCLSDSNPAGTTACNGNACGLDTHYSPSLSSCLPPNTTNCHRDIFEYCPTPPSCVDAADCTTCKLFPYVCDVDHMCRADCTTCGLNSVQVTSSPTSRCSFPGVAHCKSVGQYYCDSTQSCLADCATCVLAPFNCNIRGHCLAAESCASSNTMTPLCGAYSPTTLACTPALPTTCYADSSHTPRWPYCDAGNGMCISKCTSLSCPGKPYQCLDTAAGTIKCVAECSESLCPGQTGVDVSAGQCVVPSPTNCALSNLVFCEGVIGTSSRCVQPTMCGETTAGGCRANYVACIQDNTATCIPATSCSTGCTGFPVAVATACAVTSPRNCFLAGGLSYCSEYGSCVSSCSSLCLAYRTKCTTATSSTCVSGTRGDCDKCVGFTAFDASNAMCVAASKESCQKQSLYYCETDTPRCVSTCSECSYRSTNCPAFWTCMPSGQCENCGSTQGSTAYVGNQGACLTATADTCGKQIYCPQIPWCLPAGSTSCTACTDYPLYCPDNEICQAGSSCSQCPGYPVHVVGTRSCRACNIAQDCNNNAITVSVDATTNTCTCTCKVGYSGTKCELCATGYYRTSSLLPCTLCSSASDCSGRALSVASNSDNTACKCTCSQQYTGSDCSVCPDRFVDQASINVCSACKPGYGGSNCDYCTAASHCNSRGTVSSVDSLCVCSCGTSYAGTSCGSCAEGYVDFPSNPASQCRLCTAAADCNGHASAVSSNADRTACVCTCEPPWTGEKCATCPPSATGTNCNVCAEGYIGFPYCTQCTVSAHCNGNALSATTSGTGQSACVCTCKSGYDNTAACDRCATGYAGYPYCRKCSLSSDCGSRGVSVTSVDNQCVCTCANGWEGALCATCPAAYEQTECKTCATGLVGIVPNCVACTATTCNSHATVFGPNAAYSACSCRCIVNDVVGYSGQYCGQCAIGYVSYPTCRKCSIVTDCSNNGILVTSNSAGTECLCTCSGSWTGSQCNVCPERYEATACASCAIGYILYPTCTQCTLATHCSGHATAVTSTDGTTCSCTCATGYSGTSCSQCAVGYISYPRCTACSISSHCGGHADSVTSVSPYTSCLCTCSAGFRGANCQECEFGYINYPLCTECSSALHCNNHANSVVSDSTRQNCICYCADMWTGTTCNACDSKYNQRTCASCAVGRYNYPTCQECTNALSCNSHALTVSVSVTNQSCECTCSVKYTGASCNACMAPYHTLTYPRCLYSLTGLKNSVYDSISFFNSTTYPQLASKFSDLTGNQLSALTLAEVTARLDGDTTLASEVFNDIQLVSTNVPATYPDTPSNDFPTWAAVVIAVAGAICLIVLCGVLVFCCVMYQRGKRQEETYRVYDEPADSEYTPEEFLDYYGGFPASPDGRALPWIPPKAIEGPPLM